MRVYSILLCLSVVSTAASEEWHGKWRNKRTRSSGPLRCLVKKEIDGRWKARFSGSFDGRPFKYTVTFKEKDAANPGAVSGVTTIDNRRYKWQGTLDADSLIGTYKADNGYFGDFILRRDKDSAGSSK